MFLQFLSKLQTAFKITILPAHIPSFKYVAHLCFMRIMNSDHLHLFVPHCITICLLWTI